ncbi:hypothetical protein RDWZM_005645 [Blomia tropicalis]|uniref:Uncharacterized protein n=1 Tax=Blomia tropicalis TaxID=40697 RepID=A0A9Q0RL17_BLOTA|nr:hypothetical protein BLOT_006275 [Blomia tropicalis]KAJ6219833.1 hypothetical protein RDWZM_005645 [Blomia tropicalis]
MIFIIFLLVFVQVDSSHSSVSPILVSNIYKSGFNCTKPTDCGESTICGIFTGSLNCICRSGYKASPDGIGCEPISCQRSSDCQVYDFNLECNYGCHCKEPWIIDEKTQQCSLHQSSIDGTCENDNQCGNNAFCDLRNGNEVKEWGRCRCKVGFENDAESFNCTRYRCNNSTQEYSCQHRWGVNMKCLDGICECDESKGFITVEHLQLCIQRAQYLSQWCIEDKDCGFNAYCFNKKCHCTFGMIINENNYMDCEQFYCKHDGECHQFDANSICFSDHNKHLSTCKCLTPNYEWNPLTRKCEGQLKTLRQIQNDPENNKHWQWVREDEIE